VPMPNEGKYSQESRRILFCVPFRGSLGGVHLSLPARIIRRGFGVHDAEAVFRHACRRRWGRAPRAEGGKGLTIYRGSSLCAPVKCTVEMLPADVSFRGAKSQYPLWLPTEKTNGLNKTNVRNRLVFFSLQMI